MWVEIHKLSVAVVWLQHKGWLSASELQGCFSLTQHISSAIKRKYSSSNVALTVKTYCLLDRVVICD